MSDKLAYQVELVWNRAFNFVPHGPPHADLESAIQLAYKLLDMGDGAYVKKVRVTDSEGVIHWPKVTR